MGSPGRGVAGSKNDLKNSLDKLGEFNYVVEASLLKIIIMMVVNLLILLIIFWLELKYYVTKPWYNENSKPSVLTPTNKFITL